MRLRIHRKEQWDLWAPSVTPYLCMHVETSGRNRRVFCLWHSGLQVGRRVWRWNVTTNEDRR